MIDENFFLLERPYGDVFERALNAYYTASQLWFSRPASQPANKNDSPDEFPPRAKSDRHSIDLTNQLFHREFGADNNKYHPHLYEGDISLRSAKANVNRPYRPTRLLLQLVARTYGLEARIKKFHSAQRRAERAKLDLADVEFLFSPLYFVRLFLADPNFTSNDAYVHSVIRAYIFSSAWNWIQRADKAESVKVGDVRRQIYKALDFSAITECLQKIESHWNGRDNIEPKDATDFIVMHLLASRGYMVLRLGRRSEPHASKRHRLEDRRTFLKEGSHAFVQGNYEFRVVPEVRRLPTASELINQLDGVPLALPGFDTVLLGGLRTSENHGLVCRITGKSGTGKTSFALGLSIALAPLGTRTIYLSAEERPEDLAQRVETLTPDHIRKMHSFPELRQSTFVAEYIDGPLASKLDDVDAFLHDLQLTLNETSGGLSIPPPGLADLLIVIDGVHELFESQTISQDSQQSEKLRKLVEASRKLRAIVLILTAKEPNPLLDRLDYLVDFVGVLGVSSDETDSEPTRRITIAKTRRQLAHIGTHLFHISGRRGLRISPNVATQANGKRNWKWVDAREDRFIDFLLKPRVAKGLKLGIEGQRPLVRLFDRSQILVTGLGSGSKSAFGLRILSAPIVTEQEFMEAGTSPPDQLDLEAARSPTYGVRSESWNDDSFDNDDFEDFQAAEYHPILQDGVRRALILSFLYPEAYYRRTWKQMRNAINTGSDRLLPPRRSNFQFDVHTFVPGYLHSEDFLRIVNRLLDRAELLGTPYDGVLIDGLHNVYLQFPLLEKSEMVWPMFYETLRTRGLTVVTTHTYFSVDSGVSSHRMDADIDTARRRVAPLLHALVQATDFSLRVTPVEGKGAAFVQGGRGALLELRIDVLGAFGQRAKESDVFWDRDTFTAVRMRRGESN